MKLADLREIRLKRKIYKREGEIARMKVKLSSGTPDPYERHKELTARLIDERYEIQDISTKLLSVAMSSEFAGMTARRMQNLLKLTDNNDLAEVLFVLSLEAQLNVLTNLSKRLASMIIEDMAFMGWPDEKSVREAMARMLLNLYMMDNRRDMDRFAVNCPDRELYDGHPEDDTASQAGHDDSGNE